ncbi:nucleolar protein 8 [Austrofundulus limnaeus]|uniref:Nucleolar protein 8 n=1 Tax=Austrofundulus limnaeus TaxID=52670 RepID=A0A2I4BSM8_AUSLI|nr:PREDICTED: nucleolar protein 8 [Austrofundulus limnaeus]
MTADHLDGSAEPLKNRKRQPDSENSSTGWTHVSEGCCEDEAMRRLYVGGLSHTVTQKDLKDRFGKFGEVEDVELRTRRDEDGVPYKTFSYININISDAELKKCLTVLNKSKWKGGTLQIEAAKESFLHRLAQERQEAAEQRLRGSAAEDQKQKLLDSLSKAGVEDFTMKAAVPGSEVPGHKDWVVSKFGRVLPVLQLRCQKGPKARTSKYDPSKYCHNIRRLDRNAADESTPVTQLTWEVQGGDDDISKKRRGEFPPFKPPRPKKTRTDAVNSDSFRHTSEQTQIHRLANRSEPPANHRPARREGRCWSDSDSDEELRRLVAAEQTSHDALQQEVQDDSLEVVGVDFLVRSKQKDEEDEEDYDSADTDELFASRRKPAEKLPAGSIEHVSTDCREEEEEEEEEGGPSSSQQSDGDEEVASSSSADSDYDAMFSNATRLEISLEDLQTLAETAAPRIPGSASEPDADASSGPAERAAPKKGITPEEILASLLKEHSKEDEEQPRRKRRGITLPAFMGTKSLMGDGEEEEGGGGAKKQTPNSESQQGEEEVKKMLSSKAAKTHLHKVLLSPQTGSSSGSDDEEVEEEEEEEVEVEEEEEEEKSSQTVRNNRSSAEDQPSSSSCSEEEEQQVSLAPHSEEEEEHQAPPRVALGAEEEEELQRKANMRRLAALQQRQKEAEEHRKLIRGALSNLDAPAPSAGKHIVFGSDDDDDEEEVSKRSLLQDGQSEKDVGGATANQEVRLKPSAPRLFADSEDEEEEGDEEEDGSRFNIRPEFEGRAGQKLMALQSRFGTDERFRMDSRFLEDEEEEEEEGGAAEVKTSPVEEEEALEEEKKKNLSILHSILGSSRQTGSKTASKAKKFRDVSSLHYDPSREEHAAFEVKPEESKKDSKSARRKKREEAQKLPDVSKEIYYDVSGDLKAVFSQAKDDVTEEEEEEKAEWNQLEEEEGGGEEEQLLSADRSTEKQESTGFKFSFFGDETETGSGETTEYKVEKIQAPKVSWHQDPRFLDSSSEEEEEEEEEEEQRSIAAKATEKTTPSNLDFFFFRPEDSRLKEGPGLFCRTAELQEQREEWQESRITLKQEYKKKHRDARRKLRGSQKS